MAVTEVSPALRATAPYSAVGVMFAYFPDGSASQGTASMVGRNDVLTATHMIYSPSRGGWATRFDVYFGADYNNITDRFDSTTYSYALRSGSFTWDARAFPAQVYADADASLLTYAESQYDVALIGLSVPVGDRTGWFSLDPGRDYLQTATQAGYPSTGTGMMASTLTVARDSRWGVYTAVVDAMGPGSSGGPLFSADGAVIGVKSAGSGSTSIWADVGTVGSTLAAFMASNDTMMGGVVSPAPAPAPAPVPAPVPAPAPAPVAPAPAPAPMLADPANVKTAIGVYRAFYGGTPSNDAYAGIVNFVTTSTAGAYAADLASRFANATSPSLADRVLMDLEINAATLRGSDPSASHAALRDAVSQLFTLNAASRGQVVLNMTTLLSGLEQDGVYGGVATRFNTGVSGDFAALTAVPPMAAGSLELVGVGDIFAA